MIVIILKKIAFRSDDGALWRLDHDDEKFFLTTIPARLLAYLLNNAGKIVSREELLTSVWKAYGLEPSNNSLNKYISTIRKLLDDLGCGTEIIQTIPRIGFLISKEKLSIDADLRSDAISSSKSIMKREYHPKRMHWFLMAVFFCIAITIFKISGNVYHHSTNNYLPESKLYEIGSVSGCPIYSLTKVPKEIAVFKEKFVRELSSQILPCVENAIFIFQSNELGNEKETDRLFISRCIQSHGKLKPLTNCRSNYDFLE